MQCLTILWFQTTPDHTKISEQVETVYKREKKYNDEAGGRLSGDMDDTKENGDKVINKEAQKKSYE